MDDLHSVDSGDHTPRITPGSTLADWSGGAPASQGDTAHVMGPCRWGRG